jgi:GGDEF domain-containing protein
MRLDYLAEKVTISIGIAAWDQSFATNDDFIAAADAALYIAKKAGRNCEHLYMKKSADEIMI